jgi:hypothetical protein
VVLRWVLPYTSQQFLRLGLWIGYGLLVLGSRGKSKVFASEDGVSIERVGESNFLIPTASIAGFTRETATIDKGVEQDGLIAIHWSHGKERLVTHLRVVSDPGGFLRQLAHVTGADIG